MKKVWVFIIAFCTFITCALVVSDVFIINKINHMNKKTFDVIYEYDFDYDIAKLFDNYKKSEQVHVGSWIVGIPTIKEEYSELFDGWYIKGTDKKINKYDFIGGDIELVARWNEKPYGLYRSGALVASWSELVLNENDNINYTNTVLVIPNNPSLEVSGDFEHVHIIRGVKDGVSVWLSQCNSLKTITLSENSYFTLIDGVLFNEDKSILIHYPSNREGEEYTIPDFVHLLEYNAFNGNRYLKSLIIGSGLAGTADNRAAIAHISSIEGLKQIIVSEGNLNYSSEDGVLYNKNKTELVIYPAAKAGETFNIPNTVTRIGYFAFANNKNLESITIPGTVKDIADQYPFGYSFAGSEKLANIVISEGVEAIGTHAFADCPSLISITIPESLKVINGFILNSTENLIVKLPANSVWELYDSAYAQVTLTVDGTGENFIIEGVTSSVVDILAEYDRPYLRRATSNN